MFLKNRLKDIKRQFSYYKTYKSVHFEEKDICRYDEFPVAGGGSPIKVNILLIVY